MPRATTCNLYGRSIGIEESLRLRDEAVRRRGKYPAFRCIECDALVRPHKRGTTGQSAHFEHRERNPDCPLGS